MRSQFVECKYRYQARKICPWASVIKKAEGGYWCWESWEDYRIWNQQK